ncbi:agouti-related protein [Conger conger]|uniref:agouti-related protein n=1 Tax=Conger conger TaxID=82655 RepID=UPI002A5ADEA2|nr:agouti-related protein [Conger conger]
MWSSVMVFWLALHLIRGTAGAVHANSQFGETQPSQLQRVEETSFLSDLGEGSYSSLFPAPFIADNGENLDVVGGLNNGAEDVSGSARLQRRGLRTPRRCFRHQESCLGHQLPCCDPCDSCYCRFFNAICYCRRIGGPCQHGRH